MNDYPFSRDGSDHLDLILATSDIGLWELDVATGTAVRNRRHDQIFGHEKLLDEWSADIFLSYVVKEDRARVRDRLTASLTDGEPWSFETRIRRADGADRWISAKGTPKFSADGKVVKLIGHVIDITETKLNEDRLKLLSKELNHRVANTFTIMNSMIRHASKRATSVDDFAATLIERLAALSRANRILVAEEAERSSLREILTMELKAFAGWRERISIEGDTDVWFSGEASEALAMIFHELLTNAVKHGALSVPTGHVAVGITLREQRRVHLTWVETGGPAIAQTRRTGIGSSILSNAMRDEGSVALDFSGEGLRCDIVVFHSFQRRASDPDDAPSPDTAEGTRAETARSSEGLRIMVVEDDPIIGMDISDIFRSRGAEVLGPFTTVASALAAVRLAPDVALLDVNLGQETSEIVAERLVDNEIPYLFLSGQIDLSELGPAFRDTAVIGKPFSEDHLVRRVMDLVDEPGP